MNNKAEKNAMDITKKIIDEYIQDGDLVLDATIGNGNDTFLLARKVGKSGKVYGFDIQEIAIKNTEKLLIKEDLMKNVTLIKDSHENIGDYIEEELDFVIYNLGYLPKGDKEIKTEARSSVNSINKALELLKDRGILVVTVYRGHPGGMEEKRDIEDLIVSLDQSKFNALKYEFINQKNNPPLVYRLEKIKS